MAHAYKWRTSPEILARLIDGNGIKTWRSRRVTLKPNEACTFIVNGQLSPIFSDQSIAQLGGGFPRYPRLADEGNSSRTPCPVRNDRSF